MGATAIPSLAQDEKTLATARAKRESLTVKFDAAVDVRDAAKERRTEALMALSGCTPDIDLNEADKAFQVAQSQVDALDEAIKLVDTEILKAQERAAAAMTKDAQRQLRRALKELIEVMEEGDEVGRIIKQYTNKFEAIKDNVQQAMNGAGIADWALLDKLRNRHDKIAMIPAELQGIIVQTGSTVSYGLADRCRATWNQVLLQLTNKIGDEGATLS